LQENKFIIMPY